MAVQEKPGDVFIGKTNVWILWPTVVVLFGGAVVAGMWIEKWHQIDKLNLPVAFADLQKTVAAIQVDVTDIKRALPLTLPIPPRGSKAINVSGPNGLLPRELLPQLPQ